MSEKYRNSIYELDNQDLCLDKHPFEPFIHDDTEVLIVGTCPPHRFCVENNETNLAKTTGILMNGKKSEVFWFYGSSDNSLWEKMKLQKLTKQERQDWCEKHRVGFLDLFSKVVRYGDSSSDLDIFPKEVRSLYWYLCKHTKIKKVLFTSDWIMRIAKLEYLKANHDFLFDLNKARYKIGNETVSYKYVTKSTFLFRDENKKDTQSYREVKICRISSPSGRNSSSSNQGWDNLLNELKKS